MFRNLANILSNKKITMKAYAEFLDVSEKTVQNKMKGITEFTLEEVMKTCTVICPEYKIDYVFERIDVPLAGTGIGAGALAAGA